MPTTPTSLNVKFVEQVTKRAPGWPLLRRAVTSGDQENARPAIIGMGLAGCIPGFVYDDWLCEPLHYEQ